MAEKIKRVKPEDLMSPLHSSSIVQSHPQHPIFSAGHVPYPSVIAYNAGVIKYQGQYVMAFRNDYNWSDEEQRRSGFRSAWRTATTGSITGGSTPNRSVPIREISG